MKPHLWGYLYNSLGFVLLIEGFQLSLVYLTLLLQVGYCLNNSDSIESEFCATAVWGTFTGFCLFTFVAETGSYYAVLAVLELTVQTKLTWDSPDLPASAFWGLELKVWCHTVHFDTCDHQLSLFVLFLCYHWLPPFYFQIHLVYGYKKKCLQIFVKDHSDLVN